MKIAFNETSGQYEQIADAAPASAPVAEMENVNATLNKLANYDVMGLPIGGAVVGGLGAILIDRVLLQRIDPTHKYTPWSLLIASGLMGKFGRKYLGDAAKYASLILAYEGVADYMSSMIDKYNPVTPAATAQSRQATASAAQVGSPAAGDYYSQAFRR
jgi:hypothetical protein